MGCGLKPWRELLPKETIEYLGVDFDKNNSSADIIAPAHDLPIPDSAFNALVYSEVLEHMEDLPSTLKEMRRVAELDALVFISSPFVFPEHGRPYDFQRLTRYFYKRALKTDEIVILRESNSSLGTVLVALNLFLESSPFRALWGFKHPIYTFNNLVALAAEIITKTILVKLAGNYASYFFLMPLGYSLIVRIKK